MEPYVKKILLEPTIYSPEERVGSFGSIELPFQYGARSILTKKGNMDFGMPACKIDEGAELSEYQRGIKLRKGRYETPETANNVIDFFVGVANTFDQFFGFNEREMSYFCKKGFLPFSVSELQATLYTPSDNLPIRLMRFGNVDLPGSEIYIMPTTKRKIRI